ncbi:MAG: hypothetical protein ACK50Z_11715 [Betaproteobacteria bacterium]
MAASLARIELAQDAAGELLDELLADHRARRPADTGVVALLASIHDELEATPWCASWLCRHAQDEPGGALSAAIDAAVGAASAGRARRLAAFVARHSGTTGTWRLERVGSHRDGLLWRVSRLLDSQESLG